MDRPLLRRALVGLWAAVSLACARPAEVQYDEALAATRPADAHAVHGERLKELMRGLQRLRNERLPPAMDLRGEKARRSEEIAKVAAAMAESAKAIAAAPSATARTAEERREFREAAKALERSAQRLAEDAPRIPARDLGARLAEVDATCGRCHQRFRTGTPDAG